MNHQWDLSSIYPDFTCQELSDDKQHLYHMLTAQAEKYHTYFEGNSSVTDKFINYIQAVNEINTLFLKIAAFARLHASEDINCTQANELQDELNQWMPFFSEINTPFLKFLKTLDDLDFYINGTPLLEEHRHILHDLKAQANHLLGDEAELLLNSMQSTGSFAWQSMHDDLLRKLLVDVPIGSETKSVPLSVARNMAYAQSPELRRSAYHAELKSYRKINTELAACLNGIKGEALTIVKARGFESPLSMTLSDNRMDRPTLDAMFGAIEDALPDFRRYLKKKASLLGHPDSLPFYDLYAPVGQFELRFSYEDAKSIILREFYKFSTDLGDFAQNAFNHNWIDVEPREGKISGTFCCNIHAVKESRIMLNYTGSFYDLSMISHELGHAYHNYKFNNLSILNNDFTMPLAESASIFCETLTTNAILANATDEERFAIYEHNLLNYTQICVEILCRYIFETKLFEEREKGPVSYQTLNKLMLEAQKLSYGDGLTNHLHEYMWACKPHYYFPDFHFYNISYPYGLLFSKGLFFLYQQEGASFVPKFETVLEQTGSRSIRDIFSILGIPSDSKDFYRNGMSLVLEQINAFNKMQS